MNPDDIPQFENDPDEDLSLEELLMQLAAEHSGQALKRALKDHIEQEPDTSVIEVSEEAIEAVLKEIATETTSELPVRPPPPTPITQPTPTQPEQFPKPLSALLDAQLIAEAELELPSQETIRAPVAIPRSKTVNARRGTLAILAGILGILLIIAGATALISIIINNLNVLDWSLADAAEQQEALPLRTETPQPDVTPPSEKPEDSEPTLASTPIIDAGPQAGDQVDQDGTLMLFIPESRFPMGSAATAAEQPIHDVDLDAYYIDVFEVTNTAWAGCVESGVCDLPGSTFGYDDQPYYSDPEFEEYPVAYVNWSAAQEYCAWRGTRLPTEAEWELAARFDPDDQSVSAYPWGDSPQRGNLNYCDASCLLDIEQLRDPTFDDGYPQMSPVGAFERDVSALGVLDMGGNMVEWVNDWFADDYYADSPAQNPTGPNTGTLRTVRGGGWSLPVEFARATRRAGFDPATQAAGIGFRCAVGADVLN